MLYCYARCKHYEKTERIYYNPFNYTFIIWLIQEGVSEQLKADNQIEWVGKMNNIRKRATEIINHDIIYN